MNDKDKLVNFIVHLSEKGIIKKGTSLVDEVKYYMERVKNNVDADDVISCSNCKDNGKCTVYNSGESNCIDILRGNCKFYNR